MIRIPGYILKREIGVGGMAKVYLAVQTSLERQVALKVMSPALAADESFSKRFLREARTVAGLSHPNIVSIYDVGVTKNLVHYFSMQHLPDGDFSDRSHQNLKEREIIRVMIGICRALAYAHKKGFVHRDVTPGNILFDASGTPVLTDFGIVKAVSDSTRITGTGLSIGTSQYMSPEQARGRTVDQRSDLYSLGAVIFEALAGRAPYDGEDGFAIAYAHVFDPIPKLPERLSLWQPFIDKCLAKEPDERYETAEAVIDVLADYLEKITGEGRIRPPPPLLSKEGMANTLEAVAAGRIGHFLRTASFVLKGPPASIRNHIWQRAAALHGLVSWAWQIFCARVFGFLPKKRQRLAGLLTVFAGLTVAAIAMDGDQNSNRTATPPVLVAAQPRDKPAAIAASNSQPPLLPVGQPGSGTDPALVQDPEADQPAPAGPVETLVKSPSIETDVNTESAPDQLVAAESVEMAPAQVPPSNAGIPTPFDDPILVESPGVEPSTDDAEITDFDPQVEEQIMRLLSQAQTDLNGNRLTTPEEQNAFEKLLAVLVLDPGNQIALDGMQTIVGRYLDLAEAEVRRGDYALVGVYVERGRTVAESAGISGQLAARFKIIYRLAYERAGKAAREAHIARHVDEAIALYQVALGFVPDDQEAIEAIAALQSGLNANQEFSDQLSDGSDGPLMVIVDLVPFDLGSDMQVGRVEDQRRLAVTASEITVAQFRIFVSATDYYAPRTSRRACRDQESVWRSSRQRTWESPGYPQADNHPVACVTWDAALAYANWISSETGLSYRLPSETEWEYLASLGYSNEAQAVKPCERGNIGDTWLKSRFPDYATLDCEDGWAFTAPSASFPSNEAGMHDLVGNLREWVADCYLAERDFSNLSYSAISDSRCKQHVVKGTSWLQGAEPLSVTERIGFDSNDAFNTVGFRLVRPLD